MKEKVGIVKRKIRRVKVNDWRKIKKNKERERKDVRLREKNRKKNKVSMWKKWRRRCNREREKKNK